MIKSRESSLKIILPTDDIMMEFQVHQDLLAKLGMTLQYLANYIVEQWAMAEACWGNIGHTTNLSTFELLRGNITIDFFDHESIAALDPRDLRDLKIVFREFYRNLYQTVIPLLEEFHLTDYQLETLDVEKWVGKSMVIKIKQWQP